MKSQKKKEILVGVDGGHCNTLKSTQYFLKTREKPDRRRIKIEWIEDVIENPIHTEVQSDGRIRKWKKIEEEQSFSGLFCLGMEKQFTMHSLTEVLKEKFNESDIFS